jgi:hypothetical protein
VNNISTTTYSASGLSLNFTPTRSDSILIIDVFLNGVAMLLPSVGATNWGTLNLGWGGSAQRVISDFVAYVASPNQFTTIGSVSSSLILPPNHDGLTATAARTYQIFGKINIAGGTLAINHSAGGTSTMIIQEVVI